MAEGEQKLYPPSKKKLQKERKKGHVPYSSELASACLFGAALLLLRLFFSLFYDRIEHLFESILSPFDPLMAVKEKFLMGIYPLLFWFVTLFILQLIFSFIQVGWVGARKKPGKKGGKRWLFQTIKGGIIGVVAFGTMPSFSTQSQWVFSSSTAQIHFIFHRLFLSGLAIVGGLILLGIGDLFYQRWKFLQEMKMTRQEWLEEQKEEAGHSPSYRDRLR